MSRELLDKTRNGADDFARFFSPKKIKGMYTCPLCEYDQVEIDYDISKDGELCFGGALFASLTDAGWNAEEMHCERCDEKMIEADHEDHMYQTGKEEMI